MVGSIKTYVAVCNSNLVLSRLAFFILIVFLFASPWAALADVQVGGASSNTKAQSSETSTSLAKAAQKANNPVSDAWLLITQNDLTKLHTPNGQQWQNRTSFQPVMPVPIFGGEWNLVNRVVAGYVSSPVDDTFNSPDFFGSRTSGFTDTVFFSLFAPNRDDGFIWGAGPTFILPTASEDTLGQEKWQAGPAGLAVRLGNSHGNPGDIESWNIGALAQQWWSIGGDEDRDHTNQADIQYFVNYKSSPTDLIGMTPNIQVDWTKDGSDRFTVPIGIGKIGMFKWGNTPVRWGVELQHYIHQPDEFGPEWNLKFFIAPIKANPYKP